MLVMALPENEGRLKGDRFYLVETIPGWDRSTGEKDADDVGGPAIWSTEQVG